MAAGAPQADPMSIMRMVMAHKRVAMSPFSQLQDPGSDMLAQQQQSPFRQTFKPQAKPLVPQAAQEPEPSPKSQAPSEAPKGTTPLPQRPPVMASSAPATVGPQQPTEFQNRLGDVTAALNNGTFDTTGANAQGANPRFTTFGPDMHGVGHTPGLRFVDAAAKSAGLDPQKLTMQKSDQNFMDSLGKVPVNAQNWDRMLQGTQPSTNVQDLRGERTWMNKPVEAWNEQDKAGYDAASEVEKNQYLGTLINGAMGDRSNYADEYQALPTSNQEAQR